MKSTFNLYVSADQSTPNVDDRNVFLELIRRGHHANITTWDDPNPPPADVGIIRSTWDYTTRHHQFAEWVRHTAHQHTLINPAATIEWNTSKEYLFDLAAAGIPTIPTVHAATVDDAHATADREGWDYYVIKPAISAGGRNTTRHHVRMHYPPADGALPRGVGLLVQPFLTDVTTRGEHSLTFIDGRHSHTVLKHAAPGEFLVQDHYGGTTTPVTPPGTVLQIAQHAMDALPHPCTYARVDIITTATHGPVVIEVELIEPDLFLRYDAGATTRFVNAITRKADHP